ncbi:hypothetical protein K488DRAFT_82975 [Vararia minispora EC-137]|uniref:Uncharacterized protein n=1 Tax=Vararia minispora EC-137 TaxID=1314806 RepID=A0ACB8QUN5_9AGAM|nr:hypothetical protein K488DRAFT_82975 [Vararia minispora EC-137]
MPSFLSKVIGRRKSDDKDSSPKHRSDPSLLEGQAFEAVSPASSPSATHFSSQENVRGRETFKVKNILRARSKSRARSPPVNRTSDAGAPHLSLNLSSVRDRKGLDALFEVDPDAYIILNDAVLGGKRLTPEETLGLVRACSRLIVERGLETLGIMHAHWHSASLDTQRKLISLYVVSIDPSPSASATAAFESELSYTRSPHDVAAVFRWGLRHLLLSDGVFGTSPDWYPAFAEAERSQSFPLNAFSNSLAPRLPQSHKALLEEILDVFSSLAAHSEANGFSGSRLAKFLGLWLLAAERNAEGDDWGSFYDRWERNGRMLEHLFLARIRDEASRHPMPKRLTELVQQYPYAKDAFPSDGHLLPRPKVSTRLYDALYVRVDTEYSGTLKPAPHPFNTIASALSAEVVPKPEDDASGIELSDGVEPLVEVWRAIKVAARGDNEDQLPVLSNIFSDASVRLLSLLPATEKSPTFALTPFDSPQTPRQESSGPLSAISVWQASKMSSAASTTTVTAASTSLESPPDWQAFTAQGFSSVTGSRLAATLWDKDIEKSVPPEPALALSRKSSRRGASIDRPQRLSFDVPTSAPTSPVPAKPASEIARVARIKLDEAFVDFWTDALLDPISSAWPKFVVCELKMPQGAESTVSFLVIEQAFVRPPPPKPPKPETSTQQQEVPDTVKRPTSPRLSLATEGRFSFTKRRFPFFSEKGERDAEKSAKRDRKPSKTGKVGEMGEIVDQEEPKEAVQENKPSTPVIAAGVVATAATAAAATAIVETASGSASTPVETRQVVSPTEPDTESIRPEPVVEAAEDLRELPAEPVQVPAGPSGDVFPSAPEHTALAGSTPGPALALTTSEPVAVAVVENAGSVPVDVPRTLAVSPPAPVSEEQPPADEEPVVAKEIVSPEPGAVASLVEAKSEDVVLAEPEIATSPPADAAPVDEAPTIKEPPTAAESPAVAAEESAAVTEGSSVVPKEPAVFQEPVPVQEHVVTKESIAPQEPTAVEETATVHVFEGSTLASEPVTAEESATAAQPSPTEGHITVDEPTFASEGPTVAEKPSPIEADSAAEPAVEEPTLVTVEKAAVTDQDAIELIAPEESALVEESTGADTAFKERSPVTAEASMSGEPVTAVEEPAAFEPVATDAPAVLGRPNTTEEPAIVEAPTLIEEPVLAEERTLVGGPTPLEESAAHDEPIAAEVPTTPDDPAPEESVAILEHATSEEAAAADEPVAVEEHTVSEEPLLAEEPTLMEEPTAVGSTLADESVAHEEPAAVEVSMVLEEPTLGEPIAVQERTTGEGIFVADAPVTVEEPPVSKEPAPAEEPIAEEPETEAPTAVEESVAIKESAAVEESVSVAEPAVTEEPVVAVSDDPSPVEQPAAEDEPVAIENSVLAEEPAAADEPVSAGDPAPVEEPMTEQLPVVAESSAAEETTKVENPITVEELAQQDEELAQSALDVPIAEPPTEQHIPVADEEVALSLEDDTAEAEAHTGDILCAEGGEPNGAAQGSHSELIDGTTLDSVAQTGAAEPSLKPIDPEATAHGAAEGVLEEAGKTHDFDAEPDLLES